MKKLSVLGVTILALVSLGFAPATAVSSVGTGGYVLPGVSKSVTSEGIESEIPMLVAPNHESAEKLVGASERVESGYLDVYVATYDHVTDTGYYSVTRDQEISLDEARVQLDEDTRTKGASVDEALETKVVLVFSRFTSAETDDSLSKLARAIQDSGEFAAFHYDPAVDAIRASTNPEQVERIVSSNEILLPIVVEGASATEDVYRSNMPSPFRGGGAIYDVNGTVCTSGIPAYNAAGTPGYFTSAHCFALNSWTFASSTLAGGSNTGLSVKRWIWDWPDRKEGQ